MSQPVKFSRKSELILLVLLLLIAAFLRFHQLSAIPPGLTHDEGFYGIDALSIVQRGNWRIFYEGNSGNEPLFFYLQAIAIWLWGISPFSLRVFPAFVGILTVPSVYLLTKKLYGARHRVPVFTAAVLAVMYWHVHFSRMGLRAITLPLVETWMFYFFWRAWRGGGRRDFVFSGFFLGLSAYTFTSARLLPLILVIIAGGSLLTSLSSQNRLTSRRFPNLREVRQEKGKLRGFTLLVLASILTFSPLGYYFLTHSRAFVYRAGQVAATTDIILPNAVKSLLMFFTIGDQYWAHSVAGRPILDGIMAFFFVIGLGRVLTRFRNAEYAFLPLWIGVMLLSTILSDDAPHVLRALGAVPPVAITIALGIDIIYKWAHSKWQAVENVLVYALCLFILLTSGIITYHTYFLIWARHPEVAAAFETDRIALVNRVVELSRRGDVFFPLKPYRNPVTHFLLSKYFPRRQPVMELPASDAACFVVSPGFAQTLDWVMLSPDDETVYIPPPLTAPLPLVDDVTCDTALVHNFTTAPKQPLSVVFDASIELVGYHLLDTIITPDEPPHVALYWRASRRVRDDYRIFVHLLDVDQNVWGSGDHQPVSDDYFYPTTAWRVGEIVPDRCYIKVNPDIPPGKYTLEVGLYDWITGKRLKAGAVDRALFGALKVAPEAAELPAITAPRHVNLGDKITFLGYNIDYNRAHIDLELFWRGEEPMDISYTVFAHVMDTAGQIVAQVDSPPRSGAYPTDIWGAGEVVQDEYSIPLPPDLPRGAYKLLIGMYDWRTGERLPAFAKEGARLPADSVLLQIVETD